MEELGVNNPKTGIETMGLGKAARVHYNLLPAALYEHAIRNGEAVLTADGALLAETGQHTGRSPKDKFIVRDANTDCVIWW
ncbi:phosphoenolpyruvate carboxykinase (ATP), partial [Rhizobium sp.]|uniref:phosphoenolpyruvate carboxykinase (ATP) n=1 Tax=Rhizobium sp. TaxID=391 RepID=UPI000E8CDB4F|nr:phosphoenolpyruvate carboxykinase (ATP) [Rhizobium sp.]